MGWVGPDPRRGFKGELNFNFSNDFGVWQDFEEFYKEI
jgi:hypothetical protein